MRKIFSVSMAGLAATLLLIASAPASASASGATASRVAARSRHAPTAVASEGLHAWEIDAGVDVLAHGLMQVTSSDSGSTNFLGTSFFNFDFQVNAPMTDGIFVSPRIIWMPSFLFPHKDNGSETNTSYFIFNLPAVFELNSSFSAEAGLAYVVYTIVPPGGSVTLNNGNGTKVYAVPGDTVSSKTVALTFGGAYRVSSFKFSLDTMVEGFMVGTKRTFSLIGAVTYAAF